MIHHLSLRNFKQHKVLDIDFTSGLNVLQGENARGKTTVLRAILYALFGAAAAGKKDNLTCWDANGPMGVSVILDLGQHGRVEIFRSHRAAMVTHPDETLLASGQAAVTAFSEAALGMDHRTFRSMLYAGQGDTQALLRMGAAGLQRRLEIIAQVDVLDRVLALLGTDMAEASAEINLLKDLPDLNALSQQEDALKDKLTALRSKKEAASAALTECRDRIDDATGRLRKELYPLRDQLNALTERKRVLTEQRDALNPELARLKDSQPFNPDARYRGWVEIIKRDLAILDGLIIEARTAANSLANAHRQFQTTKAALDEHLKLQPLIAKGLELIQADKVAQEEASGAHSDYLTLRAEQTKCPTCDRPYDQAAYDDAMRRLQIAEQSYQELQASYDRHNSELRAYLQESRLTVAQCNQYDAWTQAKEQEHQRAERAYNEIKAQFESLRPLPEVEQEKVKIQAQLKERVDRINAWGKWNQQYQDMYKRVAQTAEQIARAEMQLTQVPDNLLKSIEMYETLLEEANAEYLSYSAIHAETSTGLAEVGLELSNVQRLLEDTREKADRKAATALRAARMTELAQYLRRNRARLMTDTWSNLTHYASHLISAITGGKIHSLARDADGDFTVTNNRQDEPVEELSGAEQSIVGLSLRIALANTFYGDSNFILLDEATADCSESTAASVAGMLQSLKSQVIMVTHREGDALNANNVIAL